MLVLLVERVDKEIYRWDKVERSYLVGALTVHSPDTWNKRSGNKVGTWG